MAKPLMIIAAGGTGGHMFPASAFATEMKSRGWDVGLISDVRGLSYADQFPADWKLEVEAASPNLRRPWTLLSTFLKLRAGQAMALRRFKQQRPAFVAGFGGYPAYPALGAAKRLGIPIIVHEQNAVLGRVNRVFSRAASIVASGFSRLDLLPAGLSHLTVGNPVRPSVVEVAGTAYPDPGEMLRIFITGGSQGARILGDVIPEAISTRLDASLRSRLNVVQQVRPEQIEQVAAVYERAGIRADLRPFFDDMPEQIARSHLVIARSGAGTVSEIAAIGRPSLLIPLKIAMNDHQTANAEGLRDLGAAEIFAEDGLTADVLGSQLSRLLPDSTKLQAMAAAAGKAGRLNAASVLADAVENMLNAVAD